MEQIATFSLCNEGDHKVEQEMEPQPIRSRFKRSIPWNLGYRPLPGIDRILRGYVQRISSVISKTHAPKSEMKIALGYNQPTISRYSDERTGILCECIRHQCKG